MLIQQSEEKTLQQANYVVKDANLHVSKSSYRFKTASFNALNCYNQVKLNHYNTQYMMLIFLVNQCCYGNKATFINDIC